MENTETANHAELAPWPSKPLEWSTCSTPARTEVFWDLLPRHLSNPQPDLYLSNNFVVLDFETSTLEKGFAGNADNRLHSAGWCHHRDITHRGLNKYRYLLGGEYTQKELLHDIEACDFIVAHNVKFELQWLQRCGFDIASKPVWCTQIGDFVLAGNRRWKLSLNECLKRRNLPAKFDIMSTLWNVGIDTFDIPDSIVLEYLKQDVRSTLKLFIQQRKEIFEAELQNVMYTRCLYTPILADLELVGIKPDKERVDTIYNSLVIEKNKLEYEFNELIQGASYSSPQQMEKVIYDQLKFSEVKDWKGNNVRTTTDRRKTDKKTLAKLKPKTKKQIKFLELFTRLNEVSDTLSKAVRHFKACADADDLIKFRFNQTVTQTHRLSSNGRTYKMQGQNIGRNLKPLVRARYDGWKIGERDSSGCEFRVATELGQDVVGLSHVNQGRDFHSFTASVIFGDSFTNAGTDERKQLRTRAKEHTFKPLYGGSSGTESEQRYYSEFKEVYKGIAARQREWIDTVLDEKKLRLINGLWMYWPDAKVLYSGYVYESTKICNYPVQSIATADATAIATIYMWHAMRVLRMQSFLTNVVHDNTVAEVHPDEEQLWIDIGDPCFKEVIYWYFWHVYNHAWITPLDSDCSLSYHWSDSETWRKEWLKQEVLD